MSRSDSDQDFCSVDDEFTVGSVIDRRDKRDLRLGISIQARQVGYIFTKH